MGMGFECFQAMDVPMPLPFGVGQTMSNSSLWGIRMFLRPMMFSWSKCASSLISRRIRRARRLSWKISGDTWTGQYNVDKLDMKPHQNGDLLSTKFFGFQSDLVSLDKPKLPLHFSPQKVQQERPKDNTTPDCATLCRKENIEINELVAARGNRGKKCITVDGSVFGTWDGPSDLLLSFRKKIPKKSGGETGGKSLKNFNSSFRKVNIKLFAENQFVREPHKRTFWEQSSFFFGPTHTCVPEKYGHLRGLGLDTGGNTS